MAATSESLGDLATLLRGTGTTIVDAERTLGVRQRTTIAANDLAAVVETAFSNPLDFPPLAKATIAGDRVAIAVDEGVPALEQVVFGTVRAIEHARVESGSVQVVVSEAAAGKLIEQTLNDAGQLGVEIVRHDPSNRDKLSMLGMTSDGNPLHLNRALGDADLVIPVGCARPDRMLGSAGVYDSLFPRFADTENLQRWRNLGHACWGRVHREKERSWREQADEAGWLLGAQLVLEVVPGPSGTVHEVLAGEARSVAKRAQAVAQGVWSRAYAQPASLVVATIGDNTSGDGDAGCSGNEGLSPCWDDVARALWAAEGVLAYDGALVLCCPKLSRPGKSVLRLMDFDDLAGVQRDLAEDAGADTWAAWQLAAALQRGPVYLMSDLPADHVEELGMAPVESVGQLKRLAKGHETCIILEDAHRVSTILTSTDGCDDEQPDE